jgi:hypothetical protein
MITGDSESLCKKAYLRLGGKGLSSMGGLEGSSVSSRGSDSVGFSSSGIGIGTCQCNCRNWNLRGSMPILRLLGG